MFISYLRINNQLNSSHFQLLKKQIPQKLSKKNDRFIRFRDRQRNLFGLLLLKRMWSTHFENQLTLESLITTEYNRPYLPGSMVDFNISHAGDFVICVLSPDARVGIDIERKKKVDFHEFSRTMNTNQWAEINNSDDPEETFFKFWCIKESVIKADGRGLSIPLTEMVFEHDSVSYSDKAWHIKPFKIDLEHFGCLASDRAITELNMNEVHWSNFLQ